MAVYYSRIDPLVQIARSVENLKKQLNAVGLTKSKTAQLRSELSGLVQGAQWILMAEKEKKTHSPITLIPESEVEAFLANYMNGRFVGTSVL